MNPNIPTEMSLRIEIEDLKKKLDRERIKFIFLQSKYDEVVDREGVGLCRYQLFVNYVNGIVETSKYAHLIQRLDHDGCDCHLCNIK